MILRRLFIIVILPLCVFKAGHASAAGDQQIDSVSKKLMDDMRKYFNTTDKEAFYDATTKYKAYCLAGGNMHNFYNAWQSEIIYDINFNHFFKAMRKTFEMSKDMKWRKCSDELHNATYMMGIIYSLQGNIMMGEKYLKKALEEADDKDTLFKVQIYKELANVRMEDHPKQALKDLNKALSLINPERMKYEYSDIVGFKVIAEFFNKDRVAVKKEYNNYMRLKKEYGPEFSETYITYVRMAYHAACGEYDKALEQADMMTNIDRYKMKNKIYEMSGNLAAAYDALKEYMQFKDSVSNEVMIDDLYEVENDIEITKIRSKAEKDKMTNMVLTLITAMAFVIIVCLGLVVKNRNRYLKKIARKNRNLEVMRDKAQEAERMKDTIRNNMSHEIRTPLNIISGFAQIMSVPDFQLSHEERSDIAKRISDSSNQIVKIINNLLYISSEASTSYMSKNDIVPCNDICRKAVARLREKQPDAPEIIFETSVKDNLKIKTNAAGISNILDNMIDNACKFGNGEAVVIECSLDDKRENVVISIANPGEYIPEDQINKVFDLFYKMDEFKSGLGIGLPLSRQIAEQLDGSLSIDKNYKDGTRIIITLPLTDN